MVIYIAAPYVRKAEARQVREELQKRGHVVNSRWLGIESNHTIETADPTQLEIEALEDLQDILLADALLVLNLEKSEGKAAETGMMLMYNEIASHFGDGWKPIIVVGKRTNVFHFHPYVKIVETLEEAYEQLAH